MHVVRDGAHVVEELRVDRPALVLAPRSPCRRAAPWPSATASRSRNRWPSKTHVAQALRPRRGRRWRPRSCWRTSARRCRRGACPGRTSRSGRSLIRLPGCRKLRGTQFGVSRKTPSPPSMARSRVSPHIVLRRRFSMHTWRIMLPDSWGPNSQPPAQMGAKPIAVARHAERRAAARAPARKQPCLYSLGPALTSRPGPCPRKSEEDGKACGPKVCWCRCWL